MKVLVTSGYLTETGKTSLSKMLFELMKERFSCVRHVGIEDADRPVFGESARFESASDESVQEFVKYWITQPADAALILDIGGQTYRPLQSSLTLYPGAFKFDKVIFPVAGKFSPGKVLQGIQELNGLGVSFDEIYLVFNAVPLTESPAEKFRRTLSGDTTNYGRLAQSLKGFPIVVCETPVYANPAYSYALNSTIDIVTLARSNKDYAALAAQAATPEEGLEHAQKAVHKLQAVSALSNFKTVFDFIFPQLSTPAPAAKTPQTKQAA